MKKLILTALFTFAGMLIVAAQSFEGVIEFSKKTTSDTVNYIYYVKGNKVRIDEIGNKSKKAEGTFLLDLDSNTYVTFSMQRTVYIEMAPAATPTVAGTFDIKQTGKTKMIQGIKCSEYVVKNAADKTEVTYWMASGKYDFFFKVLKKLGRKDKSAIYIQQLTNVDGMFPFLSSQVNLETGKEEVKLEVTKIEKKKIELSQFAIPKGYTKMQMNKN